MPKTSIIPTPAEKIAERADRGKDISDHFTHQFKVVRPTAMRVKGVPAVYSLENKEPRSN
jgi:hypothetical protein